MDQYFRNSLLSNLCQSCVSGKPELKGVITAGDGLSTVARSGAGSLVDLRSGSCPDRDHAKQVLADAEWLFEFRKQHAAQVQHRLRRQDSMADVEVAHRSLRAADGCD
jgi:hypothetical protein